MDTFAVAAVLLILVVAVVLAWSMMRVRDARRDRDVHLAAYRWTDEQVAAARQDAVMRSHAVVSGKVQEHLAPLFPEFVARFNPREARFLGSPVDYVVFHGLDDGDCSVVFVEVKTGRAHLSQRERRVRRAVEAGRVYWMEMRLSEDAGVGSEPFVGE